MVGTLQKDDICNENIGLLRFNTTNSMQKLLFCDGQSWKVSIYVEACEELMLQHCVTILCKLVLSHYV